MIYIKNIEHILFYIKLFSFLVIFYMITACTKYLKISFIKKKKLIFITIKINYILHFF